MSNILGTIRIRCVSHESLSVKMPQDKLGNEINHPQQPIPLCWTQMAGAHSGMCFPASRRRLEWQSPNVAYESFTPFPPSPLFLATCFSGAQWQQRGCLEGQLMGAPVLLSIPLAPLPTHVRSASQRGLPSVVGLGSVARAIWVVGLHSVLSLPVSGPLGILSSKGTRVAFIR